MNQVLNFKTFSKAIRQKRIIELRIGVREAAKEIGVSFPTLSRCENEKMPELIVYANICKWLGVSMNKFIITSRKVRVNIKYVHITKEQLLAPKQELHIKHIG